MTVLGLSDCQPVQCEELPPEPSNAPVHESDKPQRPTCDDGAFTVQLLSPTPAAESGCSAGLDSAPDTGGGTDNIPKPTATTQRHCLIRSNRVTALKQIIAELGDETRAINDGVNFPTTPSFRSAMAAVSSMPIH
jgi:hypothetical protein